MYPFSGFFFQGTVYLRAAQTEQLVWAYTLFAGTLAKILERNFSGAEMSQERYALISVSDRTNLTILAKALVESGLTLIATTGSLKYLEEQGLPVRSVEEFTGQREILGGRVKTLHPKIHGGILAKREDPTHERELLEESIPLLDVVVVNLYPFVEHVRSETSATPAKMVEYIDIGGPTMLRAAAKNFAHVLPLIDPSDYGRVIEHLSPQSGVLKVPKAVRLELATKVFTALAHYNLEIARYLSQLQVDENALRFEPEVTAPVEGAVMLRKQTLRYGENPNQLAALYASVPTTQSHWNQIQGKELSYNNLLDLDAMHRVLRTVKISQPLVAIIKHLNPCGLAVGASAHHALQRAKECDPRSHFGGIIGFNIEVDGEAARGIAEDFAEIVVAPQYTAEALEVLRAKKNLRVIQVTLDTKPTVEWRSIDGGILIQTPDVECSPVNRAERVAGEELSKGLADDLSLAWSTIPHIKSNAVVIVKEGMLIGVGAGQMSRIDSTELALSKAEHHGHDLDGAVAASDAFFPFPDSVEILARRGIRAIIAPKGSKADPEVIAAAQAHKIALFFTSDRHFRH